MASTRGDDDNDDWCGVCREKGDLLMCDGCCLSFHCGCLGYKDLDFLPEDEAWFCWNCSKRQGKEFAVDMRPVDRATFPQIAYVAVDDSLEYYYKYDVLQKKGRQGRRIDVTLRTGGDVRRDIVEMSFDIGDRRIWRGDLSRKTKIGWVGTVVPAPGADLTKHPVPLVPQFHCVREQGHPNASVLPPLPVYRPGLVANLRTNGGESEETMTNTRSSRQSSEELPVEQATKSNRGRKKRGSDRVAEQNSAKMLEAANILSQIAYINSKGADGTPGGPTTHTKKSQKRSSGQVRAKDKTDGETGGKRRNSTKENETQTPQNPGTAAKAAAHPSGLNQVNQVKMTPAALRLDVDDEVELWLNETHVGPGGWVPGKIVERALVAEDGSGDPYFAFYTIDMLPILDQKVDNSSSGEVLKPLLQVRRPLAVPVGGQARYATVIRKPIGPQERRKVANFKKGDRVEAIVCGRYAPGTVARDTGSRSSKCRINFDNPAKDLGFKAATASQPIESVRLTSLPPQYNGLLR